MAVAPPRKARIRYGRTSSSPLSRVDYGVRRFWIRLHREPFRKAKMGPNFQNRCSNGSSPARPQRSDQLKSKSLVSQSVSHTEGHWFDPSRDQDRPARSLAPAGLVWVEGSSAI